VDDVTAAAAQARVLGGSVVVEPMEIPGSARIAVIKDPTPAVVALWQPEGYPGAQLVNEIGAWGWNELVSPDVEAATAFYTQMFGWEAADIPGMIPRTSFSLGNYLIGGAHAPQPGEGDHARWTISFLIADADESAARVQELGGQILLPPMEVPIGRFAIVADPAGAAFLINAVPSGAFRGLDGS
jgi:predicted enzyme related to lactoylglutathione lyase